jgi:hypothetical protein
VRRVRSWGGSAGLGLRSQGSFGRWGFRADARWGLGCCDPMLATAQPRCRRCVVGVWVFFLLGTGDWDCWVGSWGGSAGLGLRSQGSFGRWGFRAARDGDWVAAILCSLRPSPAAAGVWSGCGWVLIGEGLIVNGDLGSGAVVGELQDCFRAALTRVGGLRSFCGHVRVA